MDIFDSSISKHKDIIGYDLPKSVHETKSNKRYTSTALSNTVPATKQDINLIKEYGLRTYDIRFKF